jgi:hypothetical protein
MTCESQAASGSVHEVVRQMKRHGELIVGGNNRIKIKMGREGEVVDEGGPLGPWVRVRVPIGRVFIIHSFCGLIWF